MAVLYREFRLTSPSTWKMLAAFVAANAAACLDRGKPLRVIITEEERRRTAEQNRFFHGPVLDAITEQSWWEGRRYPKEFWKEYFRRRYLLKDEHVTPDGEVIQIYWSTADLNVAQMTKFLEKVQAEAASEWGVQFD